MKTHALIYYTGLITALLLAENRTAQAQAPAFNWATSAGGTLSDIGRGVAVDASGNVYTMGNFQDTIDLDPGPGTYLLSSAGGQDIMIMKHDAGGNLLWGKAIGGTNNEQGYAIALDASGNVYTTGYFTGTADFDPGPGVFNLTALSWDIFISKLDPSGNFLWAKKMGGTSFDQAFSIFIDGLGNIYTTGGFQGTTNLDPGGTFNLTSAGSNDIFISKLDANGDFLWAKAMGGTNSAIGYSIAVDSSGNVYTTGYFSATVDFDPGPGTFNLTSAGGNDIFISKLDVNGDFIWAKAMGGISADYSHSIAVDSSGNVYTTGYFYATVDFDPGPGTYNLTSAGSNDIFISKLDPNGDFLWAKAMGGAGNDIGYGISINAAEDIYAVGYFTSDSVDFDPSAGAYYLFSASGTIFIQKLDTGGNFLWAGQMGGSILSSARSICTDVTGGVYLTGEFWGAGDFDPDPLTTDTLVSVGWGDLFLVKLQDSICTNTTATIAPVACFNYTSPGGNYIWTVSGTYMDTIPNTSGCDSIITINLIVNIADVSISQTGITLTANATGANYQWIDCGSMLLISGATNQNYTATTDGSYAVIVTQSGCTDTSSCYAITGVGIMENFNGSSFMVYPNPSNGQFILELSSNTSADIKLEIINITGQLVYSEVLSSINGSCQKQLDLSGLAKGTYTLRLKNEEGTVNQKIILQ